MLQALLPFIDKRECMMVVFEKLLLSEQEYCTQKKKHWGSETVKLLLKILPEEN